MINAEKARRLCYNVLSKNIDDLGYITINISNRIHKEARKGSSYIKIETSDAISSNKKGEIWFRNTTYLKAIITYLKSHGYTTKYVYNYHEEDGVDEEYIIIEW